MAPRNLNELFSDSCRQRINLDHGEPLAPAETDKVTSNQFLMVIGCRKDYLHLPFTELTLHKEEVGVLVAVVDMVGIIITILVFERIKRANLELVSIIDSHQMTMKDFTVQCKNVICDRHTQDSRLIKMKIWLHFTALLAPHKIEGNDQAVIDVTLSLSTQPKLVQIFKMEKTQKATDRIRENIKRGWYKGKEFYAK
jgi:hypothetical protein